MASLVPKPSTLILYVADIAASCVFYTGLLGRVPMEQSPNFGMFALEGGILLGLWASHDVDPEPKGAGGGAELAFTLPDNPALDALHEVWSGRGYAIAQAPIEKDFGYTFTALDPDGHRLRVMVTP